MFLVTNICTSLESLFNVSRTSYRMRFSVNVDSYFRYTQYITSALVSRWVRTVGTYRGGTGWGGSGLYWPVTRLLSKIWQIDVIHSDRSTCDVLWTEEEEEEERDDFLHRQKSNVRSDFAIFSLYTASNLSFMDTVNTSFHWPTWPEGRKQGITMECAKNVKQKQKHENVDNWKKIQITKVPNNKNDKLKKKFNWKYDRNENMYPGQLKQTVFTEACWTELTPRVNCLKWDVHSPLQTDSAGDLQHCSMSWLQFSTRLSHWALSQETPRKRANSSTRVPRSWRGQGDHRG